MGLWSFVSTHKTYNFKSCFFVDTIVDVLLVEIATDAVLRAKEFHKGHVGGVEQKIDAGPSGLVSSGGVCDEAYSESFEPFE